jgi:hypothetical protein
VLDQEPGDGVLLHRRLEPAHGPAAAGARLGLELTLSGRINASENFAQRVVDTVKLPGETWCLRLDENSKFEKPLANVTDSLVYQR